MLNDEAFKAAAAFVDYANQINKTHDPANVIQGLTYAAARYQASNFINQGGRPDQEAQIIDLLTDLFKQMLRSNLDNIREIEAAKTR